MGWLVLRVCLCGCVCVLACVLACVTCVCLRKPFWNRVWQISPMNCVAITCVLCVCVFFFRVFWNHVWQITVSVIQGTRPVGPLEHEGMYCFHCDWQKLSTIKHMANRCNSVTEKTSSATGTWIGCLHQLMRIFAPCGPLMTAHGSLDPISKKSSSSSEFARCSKNIVLPLNNASEIWMKSRLMNAALCSLSTHPENWACGI
jgi:hypothetical protein